jgi:endonuclease G
VDDVRPVYAQAHTRLEQKRDAVVSAHRHLATHTVRLLDPASTTLRARRLIRSPAGAALFDADVLQEIAGQEDLLKLSEHAQAELERVLGQPDFLPVWFLERGAELRHTVGKVVAKNAAGKHMDGTGFLVGPGLLLTNSHVLDWSDIHQEPLAQIVPHSSVVFDLEERYDGSFTQPVTFDLDPDTLLLQSPWDVLDYVLVAVKRLATDGKSAVDDYGYNQLTGELGKIAPGEPVFIIQHPMGEAKQVILNQNKLIERKEASPYLVYEADTNNGSSGSPVYNRQWEIVALHHASRNLVLSEGKNAAKAVSPDIDDLPAFPKVAVLNEGVRVSRILADLARWLSEHERGNVLPAPQRIDMKGLTRLRAMLTTMTVVRARPVGAQTAQEPDHARSTDPSRKYAAPD